MLLLRWSRHARRHDLVLQWRSRPGLLRIGMRVGLLLIPRHLVLLARHGRVRLRLLCRMTVPRPLILLGRVDVLLIVHLTCSAVLGVTRESLPSLPLLVACGS